MSVKTERTLTTVEVAERLGVTVGDVYRLILSGQLEGGPTDDHVVRVRESVLETYLRTR